MILLRNCTLIDGTGRLPVHRAVIGIDGQRINLVGTEEQIGSRIGTFDTVMDLRGKSVIPGLVNCHQHLMLKRQYGSYQQRVAVGTQALLLKCVRSCLLCLREGETTIRDLGAIDYINLTIKEAVEKGVIVGPRIFTCGRSIAMTGGHGYQNSIEADGPDEVRKAARQQLKAGADIVKVKASGGMVHVGEVVTGAELTVDEMRAAVEVAHQVGKPTTAHAHGDSPVSNAVEAGIDCIEHGMHLTPRVAERLAQKGIWLVPTLSQSKLTADQGDIWGKPKWLVDADKAGWPARWEEFKAVYKTGVKLAVGTDGFGLMKEEIKLLCEAGMGAMGAIVAATARGAELIGRLHELGTVEEGKYADLLVIDGDPLLDITAIGRVAYTIKDGVLFDPVQLARMTGELKPRVPDELE